MKHILLLIPSLFIVASGFSQSCTPDMNYAAAPAGLYPDGPLGPSCELIAAKTIVSLTDTTVPNPLGGTLLLYIDAMRVNAVTGLPAGLALSTNVIGSANGSGPYGYWYNTGTVPNQTSAVGCAYVYGTGGDWDAAIGGGPNNDGVYPLVFEVDARIHSTSPNFSAFIPNGTWVSAVNPSFGGGSFFIYDTLVVASDYADISTSISGATNVAPATQYTYSVPADPNVSYDWAVTNGNIISGQGTNSIVVEWTGSGMVDVELTDGGCIGVDNLTVTANPTAIDEAAGINASVYPNPSNGIFTLQLERTDALNIRISDVSGRVIRSEQLSGSTLYSIDLQNAPIGVYVMEIETNEGRSFKKLIKN